MTLTRDGSVQFKRGTKPPSIKQAQREVRQVYEFLAKAGPNRQPALARSYFFKEIVKASAEDLYAQTPAYRHVVDTAVAAYCRLGDQLLKFSQMYSMDLMVPVKDLSLYSDLPSIDPASFATLRFLARES